MTTASDANDVFEPFSEPESAGPSAEFEGSNVCRAAALAALLQEASIALSGLAEEQRSLGFSDAMIERAGAGWREGDPFAQDGIREISEDPDAARVGRWVTLNEDSDARSAVNFLIAMLGSGLERESTAAAAALWQGLGLRSRRRWPPPGPDRWRMLGLLADDPSDVLSNVPWGPWSWWYEPDPAIGAGEPLQREPVFWDAGQWREIYRRLLSNTADDQYLNSFIVTALSRGRLDVALRSPDAISRSLALAAVGGVAPADDVLPAPPEPLLAPPQAVPASTMIHGTSGWKGSWWRPGGAFHQFILGNHRPNLYRLGTKYGWSGALSAGERALAATDFLEWAAEASPPGLQTVFGHSYGGEVACRAANLGTPIDELVLLSTPVSRPVKDAVNAGIRIIDIRLRFDPILALTLERQRLPKRSNVTEVLLRRWRLDHSASHEEHVWRSDDIAARARL
ncbi:hypothetical protein [Mycolicibacterium sp. lyk4-40-TYG-92]|uniref:hypothetical protein n=1 Tax=Mycolicibacterium sp. lyk4-40-TYG-92 TaxID=3040295 RepID=UPI00255078EE|nr:hypothetical protein [Mycolicibacterium sp. lyk4-40-TYG-92]